MGRWTLTNRPDTPIAKWSLGLSKCIQQSGHPREKGSRPQHFGFEICCEGKSLDNLSEVAKCGQEASEEEFTLRLGEIGPVGGLCIQRPGGKGVMALGLQGDCPQLSVSESLTSTSHERRLFLKRWGPGSHQQLTASGANLSRILVDRHLGKMSGTDTCVQTTTLHQTHHRWICLYGGNFKLFQLHLLLGPHLPMYRPCNMTN